MTKTFTGSQDHIELNIDDKHGLIDITDIDTGENISMNANLAREIALAIVAHYDGEGRS